MTSFEAQAAAGTETTPEADAPGETSQRGIVRVALSSLLGTTIEYYDFLLYGTMAALVFGTVFFPESDGGVATIAAFGTLAAGYVARPLGGLIFGHFGDRLGRKRTLVASMMLMGVASTLIGVLPGYSSIGIAAPILLIVLRTVQGIAVGGEYGGAALMVIEHASKGRRGSWVGIMQLGSPLGGLIAIGAIAIVTRLPEADFESWGWRIPFLASAILLVLGLYVRISVTESPIFKAAASTSDAAAKPRIPVMQIFATQKKALFLACAVGIGPFAVTALIGTHMVAYGTQVGFSRADVVQALLFTTVVALLTIPAFSALSDFVGRKPVLLVGAVGALVWAWPMYTMIGSGSVVNLTVAMMIGQLTQNMMYAPMAPLLSEMFGTEVRYTGVSLGYQLASLIGAGFTPMIAAIFVLAADGSSIPLILIMMGAAGITLAALAALREPRGVDLTAQIEV
ncbi:MFS family permease [Rhodococcus fascians]|uniref:MFS transporter n=1 Tax=Nocardiaceae TaxID=85025 RepID=UPI0009B81F5E|nr:MULTISPECIES: MFS transporter [Rhodococcus]MDR6910780.1 MFS family permease [Rhodococcus sp. 3258]MDR6931853.1 MFS family permease [Rhodococcus fascians]